MTTPPVPPLDSQGLPVGYPFKPEWEITPRQTRALLEAAKRDGADFLLLDCRRPEEHQAARIEGAVLIPMQEIMQRLDEVETDASGNVVESGKGRPIVVHCHHGQRSMRVTATLRGLGFTNVRSMAGGIDLWAVDVDKAVARY